MNPTYPPYAPAKLAIFSNISNSTKAMLTHLPPPLLLRCPLPAFTIASLHSAVRGEWS